MENEKIKVACYCRVSTKQKEQLNSADNQRYFFKEEFNYTDNNYELVNVYADVGVSGTKLNRPEFDKMLYDAGLDIRKTQNNDMDERKEFIRYYPVPSSSRKPKFKYIIVKNTSRFARNVSADTILKELASNGVFVKFLDLNKSTEDTADFTFIQLFQTFDENESRDKSRKVKWGFERGYKQGNIYTSTRLYGYQYLQHPDNKLVIIPEQAEVIKTIFNLYESGEGIRRIIKILTDGGILTEKNKPFCKSAIRRILTQEKYAGLNNSLKYDTGEVFNKTSYPKVKEKYDVSPTDKIESIITSEQFYKCREIMRNKINYKNQVGLYKGISKYNRLIYCGKCGSVYHSNVDKGRVFYNCSNKKINGISVCDNPNVSEKELDDYIENKSKNYMEYLRIILNQVKALLEYIRYTIIDQLNKCNFDALENLKNQNTELEVQMNNLIIVISKGGKVAENAIKLVDELEEKFQNNIVKINELSQGDDELLEKISYIDNKIKEIQTIDYNKKFTNDEILQDLKMIKINDNKKIYSLKKMKVGKTEETSKALSVKNFNYNKILGISKLLYFNDKCLNDIIGENISDDIMKTMALLEMSEYFKNFFNDSSVMKNIYIKKHKNAHADFTLDEKEHLDIKLKEITANYRI